MEVSLNAPCCYQQPDAIPSDASVTDRSGRPVPSWRRLGPIQIVPRDTQKARGRYEFVRVDVFGPVSLLNSSCDQAGDWIGRTQTSLTECTGSLSHYSRNNAQGRKNDLVPRCYTCGAGPSATLSHN